MVSLHTKYEKQKFSPVAYNCNDIVKLLAAFMINLKFLIILIAKYYTVKI